MDMKIDLFQLTTLNGNVYTASQLAVNPPSHHNHNPTRKPSSLE
jgi:hypothetical protein